MVRQLVCLSLSMVIAQPLCIAAGDSAVGVPTVANKHVEKVHIEGDGAEGTLRSFADKAKVVIGLESSWPGTGEKIVFDFSGGTVADALNTFEAQHPEYGWREERGERQYPCVPKGRSHFFDGCGTFLSRSPRADQTPNVARCL